MEEIIDYFEPINPEQFIKSGFKKGYYGNALLSKDNPVSLSEAQIALIGLTETRNASPGKYPVTLDGIRNYFYQLSEVSRIKVIDLGNLKSGSKVKDTYASVSHISAYLFNIGVIPVFFGGSQDTTLSILSGVASKTDEPGLVLIDSHIDSESHDEYHSKSYIHGLLDQFGNKVMASVIGYQTYYSIVEQLNFLSDNFIDAVRLGNVRGNFLQTEPILRDADVASFDLSAIRQPDCPASSTPGPNGFYSDDACQLANLAGLSDKMKAFYICEYQSDKDITGQSAQLVAQLIWHFIFGVSQRKGDYPAKDVKSYKKIYVRFEKTESDLVFYQNEQNKRFWVEIPIDNKGNKRIISCSERDYLDICNNEIPDRIWKNICRYLK